MGFQDHVTYNGTRYDFRDTGARAEITDLKSAISETDKDLASYSPNSTMGISNAIVSKKTAGWYWYKSGSVVATDTDVNFQYIVLPLSEIDVGILVHYAALDTDYANRNPVGFAASDEIGTTVIDYLSIPNIKSGYHDITAYDSSTGDCFLSKAAILAFKPTTTHLWINLIASTDYAKNVTFLSDKSVNDQLADLKSAMTGKVSIDGINEVTPKNLQILDKVISPNLIDTSKITDGKYITANGVEHNGNYFVTDYIPVEAYAQYCGTVLFTTVTGDTILYPLTIRWLACYDSDKNVIASAGSDTEIDTYPYTIPDDVAYVRLSLNNNASYSQHQFENGAESTAYRPYGEVISAEIKREYIPQEYVDMADIPAFHLVEGQNLINKNDADYATGNYITRNGVLSDNTAYDTTGFISVTSGDILLGSYLRGDGVTALATLVFIAAYDSNKTVVANSGVNNGSSASYIVPEGIYYVRCSIRVESYTSEIQITKTDSGLPKPYKPYEAPHYEILESYTPQGEPPLHVYLPADIYVAVGRTIELYNEQVCIDHEKYHFRWVCAEGSAYSRKFSITGTTAKNLNLDLYLYDDERNICWCGRCVIHIVAASNPTKKILPIGDSLTNWKAWLQETMLLSGNHITWVGTRYSGLSKDSEDNEYPSGTIHHEGRSGWEASDYLSNATYDFDNRYDGVGSVSGTANPFWDGTKFSLSHYLSVQTGVSTPDAVQIFLGTNDIQNGVDVATIDIVDMVDKIRTEYPSMPIFVCNTIYNANQNGYGSVGSDAYTQSTGANAWQYEQDCLVMDLMKSLKTALASYTGVYIIPLASCMDREYDFGQVMTKVNPRSNVEVAMPVERIHPQAPGYYQMADLMYSFYCGVLS